MTDLRFAFRQLLKNPGFTAVTVLTLAVAIGLNTTIFSIGNAVLLRPLGTSSSGGELVRIGRSTRDARQFRAATYEELVYLREHASSLADVMGHQVESVSMAGPDASHVISAEIVAGNYFSMLGAQPVLGRGFTQEEDRNPGETPVTIISDRFWHSQFGADPVVLGRNVPLNGRQFTIIGVAPAQFTGTFPGVSTDLWVPAMTANVLMHRVDSRGPSSLMLVGRLRTGVSLATARAEMQTLASRMADENPERDRDRSFVVGRARGLHPAFAGLARILVLGLMTIVAIVLLIACANVAGMLLARASARRGELGVRLAIGASRRRIIVQLLAESCVLALIGGAGGLVLALGAAQLLNHFNLTTGPTGAAVFLNLQLDHRVLLFTAAVTMLTALVFGLMPALQASRVDVISALKGSSLFGGKRSRSLGALVVAQVTLSYVLLVGAGLMFRSLQNAAHIGFGFDADQVIVASFDLQTLGYDNPKVKGFYDELLRRARTLPGVERAAFAEFIPLVRGATMELSIPGQPMAAGQSRTSVPYNRISDGYFGTVRQSLVRGRDFTELDRVGSLPVVIVNEAMARQYWPGEDPLGKRVNLGEGGEHEIVGIAKDARFASLKSEVGAFVFLPVLQRSATPPRLTLHVRPTGNAAGALADIRRIAREIDGHVAPHGSQTMREAMSFTLVPVRIGKSIFGVAGVVALTLASGGLYGLVCYTIERRRKEIGIRVALGATRGDVFRVIVGGAVRLTTLGVALGIAVAAGATRMVAALLYGLRPTDPLTFMGIAILLVLVTLAAGYAAARKSLKLDPMEALRHE